jgi:hypothetical protein
VDSFYVEVSSDNPYGTKVFGFQLNVGAPQVLVVDDDNGGTWEQAITSRLFARRDPFDIWDKSALGSPTGAKLTVVVREERVLTPEEAGAAREGDHLYFLAPPERAQTLDRFFVDMPPSMLPDPRRLGDFFVSSDTTLGALAEIYSLPVETEQTSITLSDYFLEQLGRKPRQGDMVQLGDVVLHAHTISESRLVTVGIKFEESETSEPENLWAWIKSKLRRRRGGN